MHDFAKLYRDDDIGQVLILRSTHTIKVHFLHPDGQQMCILKTMEPDDEDGRKKAAALFSMLDEEFVLRMVRDLLKDENFDMLTSIARGSMDA